LKAFNIDIKALQNKLNDSDNNQPGKVIFKNKMDRLNYFDDKTALIHGYKFHFVGRFTRKQQAANL